jgi:hypothetical protein
LHQNFLSPRILYPCHEILKYIGLLVSSNIKKER